MGEYWEGQILQELLNLSTQTLLDWLLEATCLMWLLMAKNPQQPESKLLQKQRKKKYVLFFFPAAARGQRRKKKKKKNFFFFFFRPPSQGVFWGFFAH